MTKGSSYRQWRQALAGAPRERMQRARGHQRRRRDGLDADIGVQAALVEGRPEACIEVGDMTMPAMEGFARRKAISEEGGTPGLALLALFTFACGSHGAAQDHQAAHVLSEFWQGCCHVPIISLRHSLIILTQLP